MTRVSSLIKSTGCDGTGVVVAVLDTGVDPGAAGLLYTTSGQRKVIDIVDCTGSGDVNTSTVITLPSGSRTLTGLTGRTLTLTDEMLKLCVTGDFHIGVKDAYQLFPNTLVSRLRKERRGIWDKANRRALNLVRQKLSEQRDAMDVGDRTKNQLTAEEYEARQTVLLAAEKNYRDTGPLYDCVVFHDGIRWRAVVDTSEHGALVECDLLEDYCVNCRYGEFGNGVMMHFGVNVHEDGNMLSIVVDGGSHGTHVAGIVAANYPDAPHLNGMAPGAQIVSLKIGDSRLSSMETHQGTTRALSYLLRHSDSPESPDAAGRTEVKDSNSDPSKLQTSAPGAKPPLPSTESQTTSAAQSAESNDAAAKDGAGKDATQHSKGSSNDQSKRNETRSTRIKIDVVNMSFGEQSRDVDKGRFVTLVNKIVHKHNVLFLSSAGNDGPALSSVSAPGGTTDALIGVGAYVTPAMLTQAYSWLNSEFGSETLPNGVADESSSKNSAGSDQGSVSNAPIKSGDVGFPRDQDPVAGIPYTWCSRGPVINGAMGVSICAPGGAIAPVPLWMLRKKMLMNGTSMSSPSAAGAVTVIVSFLKKTGVPYTSALVRRAIENTARPLKPPRLGSDLGEKGRHASRYRKMESKGKYGSEYYQDLVFAGGHGSIDARAACEYLDRCASARELMHKEKASPEFQNSTAAEDYAGEAKDVTPDKLGAIGLVRNPSSAKPSHDDDSIFLEDWRICVRVEDGSPARRGSSSPGFGSMNTTHGIYLRGRSETSAVQRASVTIEVIGRNEDCPRTKRALANMEVNIVLECAASWIEVPSYLVLLGGGRQFPVFVDPVELASGRAHFAEVLGFAQNADSGSVSDGPLFRVPIAVHKPEPLIDGLMINPLHEVSFAPGSVVRRFYEAPLGATYGLLKIVTGSATFLGPSTDRTTMTEASNSVDFSDVSSRQVTASDDSELLSVKEKSAHSPAPGANVFVSSTKSNEPLKPDESQSDVRSWTLSDNMRRRLSVVSGSADARNFEAHVVQISPQKHCAELETRQYFTLRPGTIKECIIRVQGGLTMELCLAQMWSSPGRSLIDRVELVFGGVLPNPAAVHASAGAACFPRVEVGRFLPSVSSADHCPMVISGYTPRGCLTNVQRVVAPSKSKIRALSDRDTLPEVGAISQLQLDYSFEIFDSSANVKLLFPGLNQAVYESEIEGGPYVIVYDKNKQYMFASDIYPSSRSLVKGEYSAIAFVRHDRVEVLERLREQKLTVDYGLSSEVGLDVFDSAHAASLGLDDRKASRGTASLECGERRAFYFGIPKKSSLPKWVAVGDTAVGKMSVDKVLTGSGNSIRKGSDVPSYQVSLAIGPNGSNSQKNDSSKPASKSGEKGEGHESEKDGEKQDGDEKSNLYKAQSHFVRYSKNAPLSEIGSSNGLEEKDTSDEKRTSDSEKSERSGAIEANPDQWFEEAVRKLKVKRLRSFLKKVKFAEFEKLYNAVEEKYPEDIEIQLLGLEKLDVQCCREFRKNDGSTEYQNIVKRLVEKANGVIGRIDVTAVATHFGMMIDPESSEEASERRKFETKKGQLVEVMFRKARALCNLALARDKDKLKQSLDKKDDKKVDGEETLKKEPEDFEKAMKQLCHWVALDGKGSLPGSSSSQSLSDGSVTNEDLLLLAAKREVRRNRFGVALRLMETYYGALPSRKVESQEMALFKEELVRDLEWKHIEERDRCTRVMKFPTHRAPY